MIAAAWPRGSSAALFNIKACYRGNGEIVTFKLVIGTKTVIHKVTLTI